MRIVVGVLLALFLFLTVAASAADLKIKVVDPQSAAVAGAQVSLIGRSEGRILNTQSTSAEGVAHAGHWGLSDSGAGAGICGGDG